MAKDRASKYDVELHGTGLKYKNTIKDNNYELKEDDMYTQGLSIEEKLDYGQYYFHIAAVDNNDNIGETKR